MKPFMDRFKWMRRKKKLTDAEIQHKMNFDPPIHDGVMSSQDVGELFADHYDENGQPKGANPPIGVRNGGGSGANTNPAAQPVTFAIQPPPPTMSASIGDNTVSIHSPSGMDSIVIEANGRTIIEAWDTKEAMVDRPVGSFAFADGISYIMTRGGWINLGEALEKPLEMTDRRGAIRAQKARKAKNA